jgi:ribosomal protein S18 acetylase RimI-like enzyme
MLQDPRSATQRAREVMEITHARFPEQAEAVRAILREYAESLNFELCFQSFEEELAGLPGRYAPPTGRLLLATTGDAIAGVVALRDLGDRACEMKRLYVRPAFRGDGLGRRLAESLIEEARAMGYRWMRLDTVPQMAAAQRLYERLGFRDIPAYTTNPVAGARFMELSL